MTKIVGIDLGTTNSGIAYMEGGKPTMIPNAEGKRLTPSVVGITPKGEIVVGELAKRQAVSMPERTIRSIKRKMGQDYTVEISDKEYTPQEISAMILTKLKRDAEAYLGEEIQKAVITVPAYFNDSQRQATKDAGKIAGLDVMRIINEPTASTLAYGLNKGEEVKVLVYDLGGGTFDVSILDIGDDVYKVLSTSGNTQLGGDDWDKRVIDWVLDSFKEETGIDLSSDLAAVQRIRDAAEQAKIELSTVIKTTINLPYITADESGPKHIDIELTRSKFEQMTEDLVQATMGPIRQALSDAKLEPEGIDKILLVGGATRMPMIQNIIRAMFGKEGEKSINPDECVALGAAAQAGVLSGEVKDILLLDVTSLTLSIETLGGLATPLIERNTTIPTKKSKIFSTAADGQTAVDIHVVQGERKMAKDNMTLGRFQLVGIPPAPRGTPQIEVTFDIDANGIVKVSAKDKATGNEQSMTITATTNLTEDEVEQMVKEAEKYAEEDAKRQSQIEAINAADQMIWQGEKMIKDMGDKIPDDLKTEFESKAKELRGAIDSEDYEKVKSGTEELQQVIFKISEKVYGSQGPGAAGAGFDPSQMGFDPSQMGGAAGAGGPTGAKSEEPDDEDVVDVDFEDLE
ncbi:MAG: chaperone Hsp70, co-chaperone with DnaJ [Candidatus Thorarchaeota archaeon]|nr:MAG: chaperone Hsp70, co-chaperone with DnaJ [Candidatus Thorarchaeota archaeon]